MLFSLLLVAFLGQDPLAPPPPSAAEATQLADAGLNREALAAFQARAAANPNDHEARLWIALLHERLDNAALAEAVYRSVLLEDPGSVPAMAGLGRTLLERDETAEALDVLERAEQLAPQNDAVLEALGRAHRRAGRERDALIYLERAYAVSPTEAYQLRLEAARRAYQHRIETSGFNEDFSGATPGANGGDVRINYRFRETLRISGIGQAQRKFLVNDQRGGLGVDWLWRPDVTLSVQGLVGPGNTVLPEGDFRGAVAYQGRTADWGVSYRYFDFTDAWVSVLMPSVTWPLSERLTVSLAYGYAVSESVALDREASHNTLAQGTYRLKPRVWMTVGYEGGVDDWERFSIDRIGDFRADTLTVGARMELRRLTSISGAYERQWREGGTTMGRITFGVAQAF